jgi:hypothetical protein
LYAPEGRLLQRQDGDRCALAVVRRGLIFGAYLSAASPYSMREGSCQSLDALPGRSSDALS